MVKIRFRVDRGSVMDYAKYITEETPEGRRYAWEMLIQCQVSILLVSVLAYWLLGTIHWFVLTFGEVIYLGLNYLTPYSIAERRLAKHVLPPNATGLLPYEGTLLIDSTQFTVLVDGTQPIVIPKTYRLSIQNRDETTVFFLGDALSLPVRRDSLEVSGTCHGIGERTLEALQSVLPDGELSDLAHNAVLSKSHRDAGLESRG